MTVLPAVSMPAPGPGRPLRLLLVLAVASMLVVAACEPGVATVPSASPGSPGASSSAAGSPTFDPNVIPSFVRPTPTPLPSPIAYVVVHGDTLTSIAKRFSTTPRSIAFWNGNRYPTLDPTSSRYNPNSLTIGWRLLIHPGIVFDEDDPPAESAAPSVSASPSAAATPAPTTTATSRPTATPAASQATGSVSTLVAHGPRGSGKVALTLDFGGRLDPALDIINWLVDHHVHATIFPTGKTGSGTAIGRQVLAEIGAHPDVLGLGNHSWDHPDFRTLDPAQMIDQLRRTDAVTQDLAGRTTLPWFQPPYGGQNLVIRTAVGGAGWAYTVMWDVDTIDWKPEADGGPTTDAIVVKVLAQAQGGSIVLMHLGGYNTFEALPRIVSGLRERGLEPLTIEELLGS
jgi:peptidoglycan/xylan/chitin deacetylase (PgdA/CDA1 family)/LysM repeat protein